MAYFSGLNSLNAAREGGGECRSELDTANPIYVSRQNNCPYGSEDGGIVFTALGDRRVCYARKTACPSVPTSSPSNINVTVTPTVTTQVSPQISPNFVQQYQPSGSPVSTGATQGGHSAAELQAALDRQRQLYEEERKRQLEAQAELMKQFQQQQQALLEKLAEKQRGPEIPTNFVPGQVLGTSPGSAPSPAPSSAALSPAPSGGGAAPMPVFSSSPGSYGPSPMETAAPLPTGGELPQIGLPGAGLAPVAVEKPTTQTVEREKIPVWPLVIAGAAMLLLVAQRQGKRS